jgi:succinate-acetate transporter protein
LSVNDDRPAALAGGIADPAPLGLAAFALTTFLLGAASAGWMTKGTTNAFLGYAFAYGGLCQLLAGMWEFKNRNVFGSTAFSSYGGFWIGFGLWFLLVAEHAPPAGMSAAAYGAAVNHDIGWIFLAFAIFNTYMMIWSTQVTAAVFGVFVTLELTEIFVFIGKLGGNANIAKVGGYLAVLTALVAWYTSAAGVANGMGGRLSLPVGRPILGPRA